MNRVNRNGRAVLMTGTLLSIGLLVLFAGGRPSRGSRNGEKQKAEKYLFVWAGDQSRKNPDFLVVVNFDEHSRGYGKVITNFPLSGPGAAGNEPHHVGLSADGKVLGAGGLLSILKGQPEILFFDVSDPRAPKFISSADSPLSSITDEFQPLPDRGFLVTMMGG